MLFVAGSVDFQGILCKLQSCGKKSSVLKDSLCISALVCLLTQHTRYFLLDTNYSLSVVPELIELAASASVRSKKNNATPVTSKVIATLECIRS